MTSYLATFAPPTKAQPRQFPTVEALEKVVTDTLAKLPGQFRAEKLAGLHPMLDEYREADDFAQELLWPSIQDALQALRAKATALHSIPSLLHRPENEDTTTYLDRCYAASGFLPACGTWGQA